jgi:hypothetical protein
VNYLTQLDKAFAIIARDFRSDAKFVRTSAVLMADAPGLWKGARRGEAAAQVQARRVSAGRGKLKEQFMTTPVSYAKDIKPLFTKNDIDHMRPFKVNLDQFEWMSDPAAGSVGSCANFDDHGNARSVFGYLTGDCTPRMPLGGPFWDADKLALYQRWMDDGFQP